MMSKRESLGIARLLFFAAACAGSRFEKPATFEVERAVGEDCFYQAAPALHSVSRLRAKVND
jgi:hypothetical protein